MTGSKLSYFLVIIIAVPLLFELPYLLDIWLTEVPEYALQFCQWEVVQQIIASFTVALVTMIGGVGDIRNFQLFSALTYLLRLPLIYFVLFVGGVPVTAYYVACAAVVALCIGRVYYAHVKCQLPVIPFVKDVILPCVIVTVLMVIVLYGINILLPQGWQRLLITLMASTIVFLMSAYFRALSQPERQMIKNAATQIINKIKR